MSFRIRSVVVVATACAFAAMADSTSLAIPILKLNLGNKGPDIAGPYTQFDTASDGDASTSGDQNTDVEFTGFLDGLFPDITTTDASFSCCGLLRAADMPTSTSNNYLVNGFFGLEHEAMSFPPSPFQTSDFKLYGPGNVLLLSAKIYGGVLEGPMGPPASGVFNSVPFPATPGGPPSPQPPSITGGILAPYLAPKSVSIRFDLTNVQTIPPSTPGFVGDPSGQGFGLFLPEGTDLYPFTANAIVTISANPVPEPATCTMILSVAMTIGAMLRRRSRRL